MNRFIVLMAALIIAGFNLPLSTADENIVSSLKTDTHEEAVMAWRAARHERLMQPDGWLTLVGLEWLNEGESSIGSAAGNDIRLPGGPDYWGTLHLEGDRLLFNNLHPESVLINGESKDLAELTPDTRGEATLVSNGTLSFLSIFRQSYAIRIKDSEASALQSFAGVDNFPVNEAWRVDGRFTRAEEGASIEISNVLGQVSDSEVYGTFEFEIDGQTFSLLGLGNGESDNLWFIFADRTSGHGSYGAGRFLYSDGMPENGRLIVDFNKAYNPPCAFNPYSTCPLPPQRNRLDIKVLAGEKDFHPEAGE